MIIAWMFLFRFILLLDSVKISWFCGVLYLFFKDFKVHIVYKVHYEKPYDENLVNICFNYDSNSSLVQLKLMI